MKNIDFKALLFQLRDELLNARDCFREKGPKYFQRPLGIGAVAVFVAYWYIYMPPAAKMARIKSEIALAQAGAQFAEDYMNLNTRLNISRSRLYRGKDVESWLLNEIRRTLREEGIVPLSTSKADEQVADQYRTITIKVACQASFAQIASWVSRLERSKSLLLIMEMSLKKDNQPIGSNTAEITIATLAPKGGD